MGPIYYSYVPGLPYAFANCDTTLLPHTSLDETGLEPVWKKWSKLVAGANVNIYSMLVPFFKLPSTVAEGASPLG